MNEPTNPMDAVQAQAAKLGISLEPAWYIEGQQMAELAAQAKAKELALLDANKGKFAAFVEQFNRLYPRFLKTLMGIGEILITAAHTILIAFGVPIALVAFMVVEQARVYYGALLIDPREILAGGVAWVLVAANLITELIIHWEEHRLGWQEPPRYDFSLRLWAMRLGYIVGLKGNWQPAAKSPAFWARVVLRLITVTILMLAIAGSMQNAMESTKGQNWLDSLGLILTQSSLLQMLTWVGGLMLAITLVTAAQGFSQYIAKKVIEIAAIMASNVDDKAAKIAEAAGLALASHMLTKLKEAQRTRRQAAAVAADFPDRENVISVYPSKDTVKHFGGDLGTPVNSPVKRQLTPALKKAVQWLEAHPQMLDEATGEKLSVRKVGEIVGVSYTTIHNAKKYLDELGWQQADEDRPRQERLL